MDTFTGTYDSREAGLAQRFKLNNGVEMPCLGLGVFRLERNAEASAVTSHAIEQGYRSIDTASLYGNERGVGDAVRNASVPREELFVTSKVWNTEMREGRVEEAFEATLRRMGLQYLDLYLLHWPIEGKIVESWKALEGLYHQGKIKAIGVSNFLFRHLEELLRSAEVRPAVNQIEYHPYLQSRMLKRYCEDEGIRLEAWGPFMQGGSILRDPDLKKIGDHHEKSVAQVIVRWILQTGVITIPKSSQKGRIVENSDVFDFRLSEEEMAEIAELDRNQRSGADPDNFAF